MFWAKRVSTCIYGTTHHRYIELTSVGLAHSRLNYVVRLPIQPVKKFTTILLTIIFMCTPFLFTFVRSTPTTVSGVVPLCAEWIMCVHIASINSSQTVLMPSVSQQAKVADCHSSL